MLMAVGGSNHLEIGDWVMGKSRNGELVQGFIEAIDPFQGMLKVHTVESENAKMIGKSIGMLNKWVKKVPISREFNEEQLLHLIDLALLTMDEQWFIDLSTKLKSLRANPKRLHKKNSVNPISNNRIGHYDF
jgi:hypothetical protein